MNESGTIDVGIDLGTTNSAVVLIEDGTPTVIKNNDGWDTTPSAVWLPKPDVIHVGRRARERVESDPANSAAEFKLEMGLADAKRTFARAGVAMTPRQLSAEVLRSLRNDVRHHTGSAPEFAVITVPAAFTLNQNKDTAEAAALAGFHPACPLVQEPTAAAFAYGFSDTAERAYWMVFDFGGGTFDAAVVSKRDGDLRVLNHAGDSYLGGKLIDWALIERVLAPAVTRDLGIGEFRRDNPAQRANFAKLKHAAEEAKIQLSRRDQIEIMVDLTTADGGTEPFEYLLRRDELDRIAEPFYVRAINLCRNALADAALRPEDVDRLLLVGGVTLSPGLRERLADPAEGLGIALDTSLDPTTVVARGAAIFAGTIRRPASRAVAATPGEFTAELIYEPSVTTTTPTVGGRLSSPSAVDWTGYSVVLSNADGRPPFRSARIPLSAGGAFLTEVDIDPGRTSRFTIELTDATGTRRKLTPDTLSITHRDVEFGGVRLAHSLGIQLDDRTFAPMLRKGATLPARVREVFRTSRVLKRTDDESVIRIPVVQGERSRGDRNREVGMLQIRPRDVRIDLPAGSEVEVTFEVDTSSLVTVVADVPLVQAQFEAEIDLDNVRTADTRVLRERLSEVETRLESLRAVAHGTDTEDARRRLSRLDAESAVTTAREQVGAASVDASAAAAAEERLRDLLAELDDIEEAVELPVLGAQLSDAVHDAIALARQSGLPGHLEEAEDLRRRADEAVNANDAARVRAELERTGQFLIGLERRSPDWPVKLFYTLQEMLPASPQVTALVTEGKAAIAANAVPALEAVNQRLIRLLPQEEQQKIIGVVRG